MKAERRALLKGAAGLAAAWVAPIGAAAQDPKTARPAAGDLLVRIGDASATPLTAGDIVAGSTPTLAWPMAAGGAVRSGSRLNRLVLVRIDAEAADQRTRARAAGGIVAYSAVCTHTGCEVGAFLADEHALYCDCHQSKFAAREQARVLDGPAPRPLPALPLTIEDGRLQVAGPFSARPGFEQG